MENQMSPQAFAEYIAPFLAILGLGTFILIGVKMRIDYKLKLREMPESPDMDRLTEVTERLYDDVQSLREGMVDLQERVEFTERLLTTGRAQEQEADTPA